MRKPKRKVKKAEPLPSYGDISFASLVSPTGHKASPFWVTITDDELELVRKDVGILEELHKLIVEDPFFYMVRSEPNGICVFANKAGAIKMPVSSLKLGECVHM